MNTVTISGTVVTDGIQLTNQYGNFHEYTVAVYRLSGAFDELRVVVPDCLGVFKIGDTLNVDGQFRSRNELYDGRAHLRLYVYAHKILEEPQQTNYICLTGFVCKEPIYRTTPFGREITDVLIAVNRKSKRSDYIPCIAWGRNAAFTRELNVGDKITIIGRIQSREYTKNNTKMTAYEVSISNLEIISEAK